MHPDWPGHLNNTTSHSLSLPLYFSMSLYLSVSFSLTISIITTTVWRKRCGLGLNVESCRPSHDCLSRLGHHGNKVCEEKRGGGKKTKSTPLHTPLTSILFVRLTCKRIAERMSRSKKKEIGKDRQLSLLCLACHTTMCMVDN